MTNLEKAEQWLKTLDSRIRDTGLYGTGDIRAFATWLDQQENKKEKIETIKSLGGFSVEGKINALVGVLNQVIHYLNNEK